MAFDNPYDFTYDPALGGFTLPDFNFTLPDSFFSDFNFNSPMPDFNSLGFGDFDFSQFFNPSAQVDPLALPGLPSTFSLPPLSEAFSTPAIVDPARLASIGGEGARTLFDVGTPGGFLPPDTNLTATLPSGGGFFGGSEPTFNLGVNPSSLTESLAGLPSGGATTATTPQNVTTQDLQNLQRTLLEKQISAVGREPTLFDKLLSLSGPAAQIGGAALTAFAPAKKPRIHPAEEALLGAQAEDIRRRADVEKELLSQRLEAEQNIAKTQAAAQKRQSLLSRPEFADIRQALSASLAGPTQPGAAAGITAQSPQVIAIAQPLIAELQAKADQKKQAALEMANKQGLNPAAIIAEIDAQQQRDTATLLSQIQQQFMTQESQRQTALQQALLELFGRLGGTTV